jgi:hypothetical protein
MERTKVHEEVLQCGYKRCCPTVKLFDDGSMEISDDDAEIGSVGAIKISPESVERLFELLSERKK